MIACGWLLEENPNGCMVTFISQIDYKGSILKTSETLFKETAVSIMKLQKILNESYNKTQNHKTLPLKLHIKSNSLGFTGDESSKTLRIKLSEDLKSPTGSTLTTPKSSRTEHSPEKSPKKSPAERDARLIRFESELQLQRKSQRRANFFKSKSVKIINSPKGGKVNSATQSPGMNRKIIPTEYSQHGNISTDSVSSEEDEVIRTTPTIESLSKSGPIPRDPIIEPIRPVLYSLPEKPAVKSPKKEKKVKKHRKKSTNDVVPPILPPDNHNIDQ